MDDAISRQAAIDALNAEIMKRRLADDINDGKLDEFDTESIIRQLPPIQPDNNSENPNGSDVISRQAAINALREYMVGKRCDTDGTMMARLIEDQVINKPPTIQPKIIRCMECMHYEASITGNPWGVCCHKDWIANNIGHNVDENGWCYRAERGETNAKLD